MTAIWIAFVALAALVVLLSIVVLGLLRRVAPVIEEAQRLLSASARRLTIGGLPPGSTVPPFAAEDVRGAAFTDGDLRGGTAAVLFLAHGCDACDPFIEELESGDVTDIGARIIVVADTIDDGWRLAHGGDVTLVADSQRSVARAFESAVSPQTFVVDEHGMVLASSIPNEWDEIGSLVAAAKGGGRDFDLTLSVPSRNTKEVMS